MGGDGGREFAGKSFYEVLGVSETSSAAEIKASFRRLAKETHPDVLPSSGDTAPSRRFLEILAAYEILSDSQKRWHYDSYLFTRREIVLKKSGFDSSLQTYSSSIMMQKQRDVVEWLKWYRSAINDIVTHKKVVTGSSYLDGLENDFYSAICAAFYGPEIDSMDLLPDCFEAEERSSGDTSEVLHLVSGRDLFGFVRLVDKVPERSSISPEKLVDFNSMASGVSEYVSQKFIKSRMRSSLIVCSNEMTISQRNFSTSDVYKDLELHISGRVVAKATREPPNFNSDKTETVDMDDHINVYLTLNECDRDASVTVSAKPGSTCSEGSMLLLGRITGLGTSEEEGFCSIYNRSGTKTHMIMKHRTLMVNHMHWYQVGDEVSVCECRCSRARLPPSKFWLFEPRCSYHDIGGWYIETFGRDKKGKTVLSQRQWHSMTEHPEERLHPAVYLLALAYRTLDMEDAKRRKWNFRSALEPKLSSILRWCKKLL